MPDLHDIETPFDRRVSGLIDAEITPCELVASLDERDLPMPEVDRKSRSPYPLAALVRVFLFHERSGNAINAILDRLEENPDEAAEGAANILRRLGSELNVIASKII